MYCNDPIKAIDDIIYWIQYDSYYLTRDQQSSIEWRLRNVQSFIKEEYAKSKNQSEKT